MYSVFDSFMQTPTWHTDHDYDRERFFLALNKVVRAADFNADQMGDYLKSKVSPQRSEEVSRLVSDAWAVRDFLEATGAVDRRS